jgi:hypothetical protein
MYIGYFVYKTKQAVYSPTLFYLQRKQNTFIWTVLEVKFLDSVGKTFLQAGRASSISNTNSNIDSKLTV